MKKSLIVTLPVAAFVAGMAVVPSVFAADTLPAKCNTDVKDYASFNAAYGDEQCTTITLNGDVAVESNTFITISKDLTLDLNGFKISRSAPEGNTVISINSPANVTIQDSSEEQDGTIEYDGTSSAGPTRAVTVDSNSKLTVNGGNFVGEDGIGLWGDNPVLNVAGGKIIAKDGNGITGNGANTHNATVSITDGTIESPNGAAIYQPETGNLNVSGGTLSGKVGIVARAGTIDITGGTINASGTGEEQIGDLADPKVPLGVGVYVNNVSGSYNKGANVSIANATINATNENPVLAYQAENPGEEIKVLAGTTFNGTKPTEAYLGDLVIGPNNVVMTETDLEKLLEEMANQNTENPDTADSIAMYITIAAVALLGLGATTLIAKKARR